MQLFSILRNIMKWYTQDNGVLCLGTEENQFANFHVATELVVKTKIETPLSESHIELIGSFPEDWIADDTIDQKINDTAKHFFGFSEHVSSIAFA
jgi:hypothetical protein